MYSALTSSTVTVQFRCVCFDKRTWRHGHISILNWYPKRRPKWKLCTTTNCSNSSHLQLFYYVMSFLVWTKRWRLTAQRACTITCTSCQVVYIESHPTLAGREEVAGYAKLPETTITRPTLTEKEGRSCLARRNYRRRRWNILNRKDENIKPGRVHCTRPPSAAWRLRNPAIWRNKLINLTNIALIKNL